MPSSFLRAASRLSGSVFGSDVVGRVTLLGAVAAGAAVVEAALIPGLLIGGAAVLAPRLLPRDTMRRLVNRPRRRTAPVTSTAEARSARASESGEPAPFDAWQAAVKTFTYRVIVTTLDFGANYGVIGELAAAAGL